MLQLFVYITHVIKQLLTKVTKITK